MPTAVGRGGGGGDIFRKRPVLNAVPEAGRLEGKQGRCQGDRLFSHLLRTLNSTLSLLAGSGKGREKNGSFSLMGKKRPLLHSV